MKPTIDGNIDVTPAAYKCLHSLASELDMTRGDVASVILYHYCSREAYMETLDRRGLGPTEPVVIANGTTDENAHQISITSAAYEQLRSLASELPKMSAARASTQHDTMRDVSSQILCHYCSKEDFEKARGGLNRETALRSPS